MLPEVYFSPKRLEKASDGAVSGSHAKLAAFTKAVHQCKTSTVYEEPFQFWHRVKLTFKVEPDFVVEQEQEGD